MRIHLALPVSLLLVVVTLWPSYAGEAGIVVLPRRVQLFGANSSQRLLVEKLSSRGFAGPWASPIEWSSSDESVARVVDETIVPVGNGATEIVARCAGAAEPAVARCEVQVVGMDEVPHWEFRRHVLSVLSKAGCNSGACHGALAGKGGFKLSLHGYDPASDYLAITRHAKGRRIELADPGRSLLLAKPSTALPHKGGLRLPQDSDDYRLLSEWISAGAESPSADAPSLVRLDVIPDHATLAVADTQPLLVRAVYSDGREADVTQWAKFSSTNQRVANVNQQGEVTIVGHGEGAVVVWFASHIVLFRSTVPFSMEQELATLTNNPRRNFVDDLVLDQLVRLGLKPSPRSSDNEFVRRVHLDVIGTLPTIEETESFVRDHRVDKRERLIEELLNRPDFVDFWTYKWSDLLLVNGRRLRPRAVNAYYQWIRDHVAKNTPWDQIAREIVTATGETEANGATIFYSLHQSPEEMTENVCQAFLSLSIGCAKCHDHPLEKWTNDQYYALASHFARVRAKGWGGDGRNGDGLRTLFLATQGELVQPRTGKPQPPAPLDGAPLAFDHQGDRRGHLADWMTSSDNPYFARAIANRVWANFFGIGIVNPVDDLRASNPASNEPLLDALGDYLVDHGFDLKALMRLILESETYQRSSQPLPENEADELYFSRYFPRRLAAEVLLDAIAQVTDVATEFKQIGFDGADVQSTDDYPLGTRAIQLADSAVVSNFLKTFGRNERDITCECERSNTPSIVQVLHINNGVTINDRLSAEQSCVSSIVKSGFDAAQVVDEAYLKALARTPTQLERDRLTPMLTQATDADRRHLVEDLYWSILSSREFLFNH